PPFYWTPAPQHDVPVSPPRPAPRSCYDAAPGPCPPAGAAPGAPMDRTLIIFKPDCMPRQLVGRIPQRFEDQGLRLAGLKLQRSPREQVERHYDVHKQRPFYQALVEFMTAAPVIVAVLEGPGAIGVVRGLLGATNGLEAAPGTIRGDFGLDKQFNL